ncbi:cytochrome P450 [Aspergillus lucknowensis]|uniref:Cytochrome P450 n=1 Tax=Aspergillus lucknowensis TaxID=176173 RepID=A0ABR4LWW6_9EURO
MLAHEVQLIAVNNAGSLAASLLTVFLAGVALRYFLRLEKIPSVTVGLPILGNLQKYSLDPVGFISTATSSHGECFTVPMLFGKTIWLRSPQLNKEYLETREDVWSFGDGMGLFLNKIVIPGYFDQLRSMVGSLSRGISRKATLDYYAQVAEEEAVKSVDAWARTTADKDSVALFEEVSFLVHKIIVRCLMGQDFYDHHVEELYDLLHTMEANVGSILHTILPAWVPHGPARRLWASRDRVQEIFQHRLQEREKSPEQWKNSLDYITYTLQDPATAHLSRFYGAHHTLLMFAAHTSTVASISWTLLELLKSPERLQRLRDDLATTSLEKSPFLDALVKETGRHYSGNSDVRWARKPKTLRTDVASIPSEITIPKGTIVSISPYLTHHDPTAWETPDTYLPERWLDNADLAKKMNEGGQLRYIPFGAGSHRCPGEKMAILVSKTVVSTIVNRCEIAWGEGSSAEMLGGLDFSKVGSPWLKGDVQVRFGRRSR